MRVFSRLAVIVALAAGFGGAAYAQSQSRQSPTAPDRYLALSEGRSGVLDPAVATSGAVPPSESRTVMGLRVPR